MKSNLHLALALLAVGIAVPALARDVTVSWTLATTREDGTPLPVTEIASTRVEWGSCIGVAFNVVLGNVEVPAPAATRVLVMNPGTYCFRAFTIDTEGLVSDASPTQQKVIKGRPNPPAWR